jgi:hypothetical protein
MDDNYKPGIQILGGAGETEPWENIFKWPQTPSSIKILLNDQKNSHCTAKTLAPLPPRKQLHLMQGWMRGLNGDLCTVPHRTGDRGAANLLSLPCMMYPSQNYVILCSSFRAIAPDGYAAVKVMLD